MTTAPDLPAIREERETLFRQLAPLGLERWDLAAKCGISPETIRKWSRRLGVEVVKTAKAARGVSPVRDQRDELFEKLVLSGATRSAIAERLSITHRSVRAWALRKGLPVPPAEGREYVFPTGRKIWTPERVEELRKLWGEGRSSSWIAERFGDCTKNSVIGMVTRKGFKRGLDASPEPAKRIVVSTPVEQAPKLKKVTVAKIVADVPAPAEAVPPATPGPAPITLPRCAGPVLLAPPAVAPNPEPEPAPAGVKLLDLKESMCRWPLGARMDFATRFCGQKHASGLPYCPHHARIGFQPMKKRRQVQKPENIQIAEDRTQFKEWSMRQD